MYQRELSSVLQRFSTLYPIIGVTGPRQSGKTTLVKEIFKHLPYVSLENLDFRDRALDDPRGFLSLYHEGAIFDEVQNTPNLLSYLQQIVDDSQQKGYYVLTGSQNFSLSAQISQSLSGRIGMTTLLPLSISELKNNLHVNEKIFKGGYPALHHINISSIDFYPSYLQTYVERDVRQIKNIQNTQQFRTFLKLCAGRVGQLVNFSSLAQDCGISHTTAREWLNLLEASYLVFFLSPFYKNFNKRLVKMPKLYFYDTGLACALLGLEQSSQVETHYLKGALFENLVILEVLKKRFNQGLPANLYFWRDQTGHEIDLIAEWGGAVHAFEIKASSTFQPGHSKNLQVFLNLLPTAKCSLVYLGEQQGTYKNIQLTTLDTLDLD
jgi:uncharacterized protein